MNNIPEYRAKKIDSDEYVEGLYIKTEQGVFIFQDEPQDIEVHCHNELFDDGAIDGEININSICYEVDESTLAIQLPERNFFISLDVKTGKGGDKISDDQVLIWNGEMMNCSILSLYPDGSIEDYKIDLDNSDFDEMEAIGIQK